MDVCGDSVQPLDPCGGAYVCLCVCQCVCLCVPVCVQARERAGLMGELVQDDSDDEETGRSLRDPSTCLARICHC